MFLLAVLSHVLRRPEFNAVVYVIAVSSAAQTLADPGVTIYLVSRPQFARSRLDYSHWLAGLKLQLLAGVVVATASAASAFWIGADANVRVAALALGSLAGMEGIVRYARSGWQVRRAFRVFAAVDWAIAVGRLVTGAGAALAGIEGLAVASAIAATALIPWIVLAAPRRRPDDARDTSSVYQLFRAALPYGASTVFSSVYAQAPAVLMGLFGSVGAAATYSVAARLTQATELIPSAISTVNLPALAAGTEYDRKSIFRRQLRFALGAACCSAFVLIALSSSILSVFGIASSRARLVLILLALALIPKFASYQVVSLAIIRDRIRARLVASGLVAVISIVCVSLLASRGAVVVATISLVCEGTLLLLLVFVTSFERPTAVQLG